MTATSHTYFTFGQKPIPTTCTCYFQPLDQYQYLGNCPPTPPLTQQQSIDNKLGLMLG